MLIRRLVIHGVLAGAAAVVGLRVAHASVPVRGTPSVTRSNRPAGLSRRGRPLGLRTTRIARPGQVTTVYVLRQEIAAADQPRIATDPRLSGRQIEYNEYTHALVRRETRDTPVDDGRFERTTVTVVQRADEPTRPAGETPALYAPRANPREARFLVSNRRFGVSYRARSTSVTAFDPRAREAYVVLRETGERIRMLPHRDGTWEADVPHTREQLVGRRYYLEIDGRAISDPSAHAIFEDYGDALFTDLQAFEWKDQAYMQARARGARLRSPRAVLSEVHVRDMSADESAPVSRGLRGTYAGFAAPAIVDHYASLGVDAVEILPVHNYDDQSGDRDRVTGAATVNHWGYMTIDFNAPETRYAQDRLQAPRELQSAIDAYHQRGVAVVMDVVFNHTAEGSLLHFKLLDKEYYYRLSPEGVAYNGAGTGNELRSESPMVRRMIVASLRHFVEQYHVDGFRFDLGALMDVDTMRVIDRALPREVFITAEPWAAEWPRAHWDKTTLAGALSRTRVSVWNDTFRDHANRFMLGRAGSDDERWALMTGIAGSLAGQRDGFALRPSQVVNYLSSHDECTAMDRVSAGCGGAALGMPEGGARDRVAMGAVVLLGSRGVAMLDHGQEFLRSKQGIANAHNQDNAISHIDWKLAQRNRDVVSVHQRLIALRSQHPTFGDDRAMQPDEVHWLAPENRNALGWMYTGSAAAPHLLYLANSDRGQPVTFDLPRDGNWNIEVFGTHVGQAPDGGRTAHGSITVPPGTGVVLTQRASTGS